jgi:hypothetical protein
VTIGAREKGLSIALRQLNLKVGPLSKGLKAKITQLSMEQVDDLLEAIFDFATVADLKAWLKGQPINAN